ncbi:MAG: hypothetical protein NT154_22220 [Verrucomicrobia bacterium]|nr:hypothetical protein [Verrucomicrobiota bacterium]
MRDLLLDYTAGLLDSNVEQEVRELIVTDPVAAAFWKNFNEIDARLRSPEGQQWTEVAGKRILSKVLEKVPVSENPNISEGFGEAVKEVTFIIKGLLSEFRSEPFAAHLGHEATAAGTDVFRVISLANCPELRQRLPWLGATLRVYQQERSPDQGTAKYIACVEILDIEPERQKGELRVVLEAKDGRRSETRLCFDYPARFFPAQMPADESQLTFQCHAELIK